MAGFERLRRDGKILAWGVSNFDVQELEALRRIAGADRIACNQVLYHLRQRAIEHAVMPWCAEHGVAVVAYSPFGHGRFPGPRAKGGRVLGEIAAAHGATPRQVALAFIARRCFTIPKAARPTSPRAADAVARPPPARRIVAVSIFLIRHGETPGNAARIVQRPEIPLSPRGEAQVERLARRLADAGLTAILSSDLARAALTAAALSRVTGLPIAFEPLLRERNFGDLRGTAYADLGFDPFDLDYAPPNGERWDEFHARVDRAWLRVREAAATTPGHLAVVTHGLVCRSIAGRHLALPPGTELPPRWENTSVTVVDPRAPWRVALLNCCAHLDDLRPEEPGGLA